MHLNLCQKHKLRVANAKNNLVVATVGIVNLDSWKSHELRVAVIRNTPESGVERMKRKKEQNRSD